MDKETVKETLKDKLIKNIDEILAYGLMGTVLLGYVALIGYSVKKTGQRIEEESQRQYDITTAALARGAQVLANGENGLWIIEKDGAVSMV